MNNQKYIVYSILFLIFLSFSFLIFWEKKQQKISDDWFVYFDQPLDKSLSFSIENYSLDKNFSIKIMADEKIIREEEVEILKNNKKSVTIKEQISGDLIKIIVLHSKKTKEIYKNFE